MKIYSIFKDIRFWIVFFFVIRLIGITNPPLEVAHNWRQTTVTMVARNFLEINNNILYPRVDFAGDKTGITGMEFPVLNYLIYLISEFLGYQHWYGRLINLFISSIGLWWFFKLISKYFSEKIAFNATIILTVSIWFQFSRKIMPDTFSMSLIIGCIYFGTNYLENKLKTKNIINLILSLLLMLIGVLSKLPSGYILIVFVFFILNKKILVRRKIVFLSLSSIVMVPILFWYFYWVPSLVERYQFWHFFMGKTISLAIEEIKDNFHQTIKKFYDTALKFIGFALFIYGLVIAFYKKDKQIIIVFFLTFSAFTIIILKAGFHFSHHSYYIIPFVPIMALIAGYGLSLIKNKKISIFLIIAIALEGIINQQHDFRIKSNEWVTYSLEKNLDKFSTRKDLILINSSECPTPMYFSHRKGWIGSDEKILNKNYIKNLTKRGLKYIIIFKQEDQSQIKLSEYQIKYKNDFYTIYKI